MICAECNYKFKTTLDMLNHECEEKKQKKKQDFNLHSVEVEIVSPTNLKASIDGVPIKGLRDINLKAGVDELTEVTFTILVDRANIK